jgi:hypothetical protein
MKILFNRTFDIKKNIITPCLRIPVSKTNLYNRKNGAYSIGLGLGKSNWNEEMWAYVYRRAESKGKIFSAIEGDYQFKYALILLRDGYGRPWKNERYAAKITTFWLKEEIKVRNPGTNISGHAFVFGDITPEEFRNVVGLHEYYESLGHEHAEACEVDLTHAKKQGGLFYSKYAEWIYRLETDTVAIPNEGEQRGYFNRAISAFTEQYDPLKYEPVQYLDLFFQVLTQRK